MLCLLFVRNRGAISELGIPISGLVMAFYSLRLQDLATLFLLSTGNWV